MQKKKKTITILGGMSSVYPPSDLTSSHCPQNTQHSTFGEHSIQIATEQPQINQLKQTAPQTVLENRQAFCGLQQLPKGKITTDKQIGQGGLGTVHQGTLKDQDNNIINVIIKKPNTTGLDKIKAEKRKQALERETNVSSNLINTATEN